MPTEPPTSNPPTPPPRPTCSSTATNTKPLRGFGGCFNELGWLPLQNVSEAERDQIIKELFSPDEMNFTFNRAPVGANDFADHWYSYDEADGDYEMEHFSVEHDEQTLIPYIHRAQEWQPNMQLFSSPWSPPTWMKRPKAYNYGRLVQTPENLRAYAKYFVKYIRAYAEHGITVNQLHVQNEVFADQKFPSALWDSEALKVFIRDYLRTGVRRGRTRHRHLAGHPQRPGGHGGPAAAMA